MARSQKVTPQVGMKVKVMRNTSNHYQPVGAIVTIHKVDFKMNVWLMIKDSRIGRDDCFMNCKLSDLSFRKFKQR